MFCPSCGTNDQNASQFCRACGGDLRRVRNAVAAPDDVTSSAVTAREEIGRAVAARIRDTKSAKELAKVTEEVLPEIEKFLESPEEKRLRRMRNGMIVAGVGAGVSIALPIVAAFRFRDVEEILFLAGLGVVTLFIGIALIVNGYFLTLPRKEAADNSAEGDRQRELDSAADYRAPELPQPSAQTFVSSVTEHTTKHLEER